MAHPPRPWGRAALWLAFLGPFFYLSYGTANWLASRRTDVPCIVFGWERQIPFLPWTILPYWTENLFYASALFLCLEPREVDILGRRMLTAQVVAVSCFILFPLAFSFPQPAVTGWPAFLFDALRGFDRPFNQAPSLHVALAIVLGVHFHRLAARRWRPLVVGWFLLIIGSVLTTYQHHFVDIPTGALLGWFCLWAWPDTGQSPIRAWRFHREASRWKQAAYYTGGALLAGTLGIRFVGVGGLAALACRLAGPGCLEPRRTGGGGFPERIRRAAELGGPVAVRALPLGRPLEFLAVDPRPAPAGRGHGRNLAGAGAHPR